MEAFQPSRHRPLSTQPWDAVHAGAAIQEIAEDAVSAFDPGRLWPAHPMEDQLPDGTGSIYFGAAGVLWALDHLRRAGAIAGCVDTAAAIPVALDRNAPWLARAPYSQHASLLIGELGIQLAAMRATPAPDLADEIYILASENSGLPILELMWGLPGSMLACVHMASLTGDPRFAALFRTQAARLLDDLDVTGVPIWTQDLYGRRQQWLGPVHGYAGNMLPLLHGWRWLTPEQQAVVADAVPRTLAAHAIHSNAGAGWPATVGGQSVPLCQHCHGAPGMVTTFAEAPFSNPELETLLVQGGELVWAAGPLAKGPNLCHGTAGNGYALLKLYKRTGDTLWLERARAFAMTAIEQVHGARALFGRSRHSLWTGDPGVAVYLHDCITGAPGFPFADVI